MSKSFYPTKQFDAIADAVAYCRVHASSQDAVDYLHRIGTEAPDKHAALKAVVCALIDMGEQEFASTLIQEYDNSDEVRVHARYGVELFTTTLYEDTTVQQVMGKCEAALRMGGRCTVLLNDGPARPDELLRNGDTLVFREIADAKY